MSADYINKLGSHNLGSAQITRKSGAFLGKPTDKPIEQAGKSAASAPLESFSPTSEANESSTDTQAGEARASQIFSAWNSNGSGSPAVSAGSLNVQGASNTTVNQAYSATGSQPGGSESGFTKATVYSSKPA